MKKTGIESIAAERQEQIEKHHRTVEKDAKENDCYQLIHAARTILIEPQGRQDKFWPPLDWDGQRWKHMMAKSYKDRLIIAGALIAAEIDRLQHLEEENQ